jgi:hypothetical protein
MNISPEKTQQTIDSNQKTLNIKSPISKPGFFHSKIKHARENFCPERLALKCIRGGTLLTLISLVLGYLYLDRNIVKDPSLSSQRLTPENQIEVMRVVTDGAKKKMIDSLPNK